MSQHQGNPQNRLNIIIQFLLVGNIQLDLRVTDGTSSPNTKHTDQLWNKHTDMIWYEFENIFQNESSSHLETLVVIPLSPFQCHPNQPAPQPVWDSVVFSFGTRRLVVCHRQGWRKASSATYAARFPLNAATGRKAEVWVFEDRNRRCGLSVLAKGEVSSATMDNLEHSTHEVFAPLCCYGFQCSSVWCPSPWNRWCLWLPQGTLDIDSAMQKLLPEKKHNSIPSQYNVYYIYIIAYS